ncbi:hypothetical protein E2C01_013424 [Portunus trituberculatus]|uniref:Uncharacterized protein n=1 Tax=Portunus trituberculatus TaxID=210409 RepID=A0A5B7DH23_PORTR|nr:hypothetical protein [Portunus trituberculatus]
MKGKEERPREGCGWAHISAAAVQSTQEALDKKSIETQVWTVQGVVGRRKDEVGLFPHFCKSAEYRELVPRARSDLMKRTQWHIQIGRVTLL